MACRDTRRRPSRASPRLVFGFGIMVVGLILSLDNLGLLDARDYWRYWPLLLIAGGLAKATQSMRETGRPAGVALVLLGAFLLSANLGLLEFRHIWPVFLLAAGAVMVWKALRPGAEPLTTDGIRDRIHESIEDHVRASLRNALPADDAPPSSRLSAVAVIGGVRKGTSSQAFRKGDAFAFMGGCEIDLREASIADGEAHFDSFALMGGVDIRVPPDWTVDNQGVAFLGGFVDRTRRPAKPDKRLVLTGLAVMGGVEVKN